MKRAARDDVRSVPSVDGWLDDSDDDLDGDAEVIVSAVLDTELKTREDTGKDTGKTDEAGAALDERQQEILAFERQWWRHAGAKEQAIRDQFQLSTTRYYQLLNALLDEPAALAHDPALVGRLRRLRATRSRSRTGRLGSTDQTT
jgi:hypothetical protein